MRNWFIMFGIALCMGCGSARIHYQDARGGVMALNGDEAEAMEDAQKKMAAHCGPAGYEIVKRETVVVGRERLRSESTAYDEQEQRSRDQDTAGYETSDSAYVDSETERRRGTVREGAATSDTEYGESVREDEVTNRQGVADTFESEQERDINEPRIHYRCRTPM